MQLPCLQDEFHLLLCVGLGGHDEQAVEQIERHAVRRSVVRAANSMQNAWGMAETAMSSDDTQAVMSRIMTAALLY